MAPILTGSNCVINLRFGDGPPLAVLPPAASDAGRLLILKFSAAKKKETNVNE